VALSGPSADLTVLDGDYWNCPAEAIKELKVDLTIIDGRVAYERGA
jgi:predicted amidohydrolase YtcJ